MGNLTRLSFLHKHEAVLLREANIRSHTASVALQHNILSAKSPALPYIPPKCTNSIAEYHLLKNTSGNSLLSGSQEVEDEKTYSCGSELNERTGQLSKKLKSFILIKIPSSTRQSILKIDSSIVVENRKGSIKLVLVMEQKNLTTVN
ncbi:MAG: hypothetical protein EZS28_043899 [Streblomastix strix]|uniref:Uncharacterized protein n=1 Tax=Streblomastix strix TaxID=222440 RepID=A0A5J4TQ51_9EUKA|nr:MAG: hypothetical protein EZS28_043899 [Streblomastix strix]